MIMAGALETKMDLKPNVLNLRWVAGRGTPSLHAAASPPVHEKRRDPLFWTSRDESTELVEVRQGAVEALRNPLAYARGSFIRRTRGFTGLNHFRIRPLLMDRLRNTGFGVPRPVAP